VEANRGGKKPRVQESQVLLFKSLIALTQSYATPYCGEKLRELLKKQGISMSLTTVYRTMHRLGFPYQTARPTNANKDVAAAKQWEEEFPEVFQRLQAEKKRQ
jgi:transposase